MKNHSVTLAIVLVAAPMFSSCSGKGDLQDRAGLPATQLEVPAPAAPHEDPPAPWDLRFVAHCEGDVHAQSACSGAFGFEVASDGSYRVGPGPEGQRIEGFLSEEDFKELQGRMQERIRANPAVLGRACQESKKESDGDGSCDPDLAAELKILASRYSPKDFPNPCVDADMELRKSYDQAAECESDMDCVYLGGDYLPLDAQKRDQHAVVVDDCSYASILPMGNAFRAVELQRELLLKRAIVKGVCGKSHKPSCGAARSLDPWKSSLACIEGKCRLASSQFNPQ